MANYTCAIRTNYFRVKDEDAFRQLMSKVKCVDDHIHVFEEKSKDGQQTLFGFGSYFDIVGVVDEADTGDDDEAAYDNFISGLQQSVADDDAIIIMESGHEELRYVVGYAHILTSHDEFFMSVNDLAVLKAKELLENPNWSTKMDY